MAGKVTLQTIDGWTLAQFLIRPDPVIIKHKTVFLEINNSFIYLKRQLEGIAIGSQLGRKRAAKLRFRS